MPLTSQPSFRLDLTSNGEIFNHVARIGKDQPMIAGS
jgi:hypothetical protein